MDAALLFKIFGSEQRWHGPCTVIVNADAGVQAIGGDSILGGGAKQFAPRLISGRIHADALCLAQEGKAVLILQQQKIKQATGEDLVRQTLTIADPASVVALEFPDASLLGVLGLNVPVTKAPSGSHPGIPHRAN